MRKVGLLAVTILVSVLALRSAPAVQADEIPWCNGHQATIWGPGVLIGTNKADVIVGKYGSNTIKGNGGDDIICGGWGDDKINGGSGNDFIIAGEGDDVVNGDAGNDEIWGDFGPHNPDPYSVGDPEAVSCLSGCFTDEDTLKGGTGDDLLVDFLWWNDLDGGANNDYVFGNGLLKGNSGNDGISSNYEFFEYFYYDFDADASNTCINEYTPCPTEATIQGGSGNDQILGTYAGDDIDGGSGNDFIDGWGGEDRVNGGSGKDSCQEYEDSVYRSCEVHPVG